jgi:hypothetical protein
MDEDEPGETGNAGEQHLYATNGEKRKYGLRLPVHPFERTGEGLRAIPPRVKTNDEREVDSGRRIETRLDLSASRSSALIFAVDCVVSQLSLLLTRRKDEYRTRAQSEMSSAKDRVDVILEQSPDVGGEEKIQMRCSTATG